MGKKRITDEKMTEEFSSVIDDLMSAIKVSARRVLNVLVEKTAQTTSDVVDEKVNLLKDKMKKGKDEQTKEDSSD